MSNHGASSDACVVASFEALARYRPHRTGGWGPTRPAPAETFPRPGRVV